MDVSLLIRQRLSELGLDQKDLASAAHVTESYISQLLARKKSPPAPGRTDIYEKIEQFLQVPGGELSLLAETQRKLELKKKVGDLPRALLGEYREWILGKCAEGRRREVRRIFEKEALGELERLVGQKILDVALGVAEAAEFSSLELLRVNGSVCDRFLEPVIEGWDIDLRSFGMQVMLREWVGTARLKQFAFLEVRGAAGVEPGFEEFLGDKNLSGDASEQELAFLRGLHFDGKRPTPLYYYRELQSLRDPIHFRAKTAPDRMV